MAKSKRVLVYEEKAKIEDFKNQILPIVHQLNQVNELFPINSPRDIPGNVDAFILERLLATDELTREMHKRKPEPLERYTLPTALSGLRHVLIQAQGLRGEALEFIRKNENGYFEIDTEKVEAFIDTKYRRYVDDPDEQEVLKFMAQYVDFVHKYAENTEYHQWNNPLLLFRSLETDRSSHYPRVNLQAVKEYVARKKRRN